MQESISNSGVVAPDFHERLSTHGKRLEGLQGLLKRRRRQWRGIKGSGHGRKSVRMIRGERDLGLTGLPVNGLVGCRSGDGSGKVIERVPRGMRRGFGATGPCLLVLRAVGPSSKRTGRHRATLSSRWSFRWMSRNLRGRASLLSGAVFSWLNRLNRGCHGQPNTTALQVAPMANHARRGSIISHKPQSHLPKNLAT